jgi:hypothetical protein
MELSVVHADRLARLEHADVDSELAKPPLALEVAKEPEVPRVAPAALARVDDEPAVAVGDEAVLRLSEWDLRDQRGSPPLGLGRLIL